MTLQHNEYFKEMFMVPPHIWENVKKCVNEHEKKVLQDLNKTQIDSTLITQTDIVPPNMPTDIIPDPNPNPEQSQTSFHRSQDRSRSKLETSLASSQINLPDDSLPTSEHYSSRLDTSFAEPSFGKLPKPDLSQSSVLSTYENFRPPRTSSPTGSYEPYIPILSNPQPSPQYVNPIVSLKPFPNCVSNDSPFNRSIIKTRTKTGILEQPKIGNPFIKCPYCNKTFTRKWNLKKHILTIHRQQTIPDPGEEAPTIFKRKVPDTFKEPELKRKGFDRWNL